MNGKISKKVQIQTAQLHLARYKSMYPQNSDQIAKLQSRLDSLKQK